MVENGNREIENGTMGGVTANNGVAKFIGKEAGLPQQESDEVPSSVVEASVCDGTASFLTAAARSHRTAGASAKPNSAKTASIPSPSAIALAAAELDALLNISSDRIDGNIHHPSADIDTETETTTTPNGTFAVEDTSVQAHHNDAEAEANEQLRDREEGREPDDTEDEDNDYICINTDSEEEEEEDHTDKDTDDMFHNRNPRGSRVIRQVAPADGVASHSSTTSRAIASTGGSSSEHPHKHAQGHQQSSRYASPSDASHAQQHARCHQQQPQDALEAIRARLMQAKTRSNKALEEQQRIYYNQALRSASASRSRASTQRPSSSHVGQLSESTQAHQRQHQRQHQEQEQSYHQQDQQQEQEQEQDQQASPEFDFDSIDLDVDNVEDIYMMSVGLKEMSASDSASFSGNYFRSSTESISSHSKQPLVCNRHSTTSVSGSHSSGTGSAHTIKTTSVGTASTVSSYGSSTSSRRSTRKRHSGAAARRMQCGTTTQLIPANAAIFQDFNADTHKRQDAMMGNWFDTMQVATELANKSGWDAKTGFYFTSNNVFRQDNEADTAQFASL